MSFWSRLRRTVLPSRHDAEIDEEIAFHLAMKAERGRDPRAARLRFGNPLVVREETRAAGIIVWLDAWGRDLRHAVRQLRRGWVVTAAVIASLVIGIGANAAIFALVDAALLKSVPVADPQSLHLVGWVSPGWPEPLVDSHRGDTYGNPATRLQGSSVSPLLHRRLASEQRAVTALIGFSDSAAATVAIDGRAEEVQLQYVSSNFFRELGVAPIPGRAFRPEDDRVGQPVVVVISHRLWQRRFAGAANVLGKTLHVNGVATTIVGVAPRRFFGLSIGEWVDVFTPLAAEVILTRTPGDTTPIAERAEYWWVRQMVRVAPGADLDAARAALTAHFQRLVLPEGVRMPPDRIPTLLLSSGRRGFDPIGHDDAQALWVLFLLVGLVLLIVCANVANLLLSRAVGRQRESAVRQALGAGRVRLLRQHFVESLLLASVGGAGGLAAGLLLAGILDRLLQRSTQGHFPIALDLRMVAFTAGVSLLAAALFGIAPALRVARTGILDALKSHGRAITSGHLRLPRLLVAAQMALCLTVLVAAGLLGRSLANLRLSDVGFDRQQIVYVTVNPWRSGMPADHVRGYADRLRTELAAIPGVVAVSTIGSRPLSGSSSETTVNIPGRPYREDGTDGVLVNDLGDGLVETLGLRLLDGRSFRPGDLEADADAVLVDERFARRYFPSGSPVGQRFGTGRQKNDTNLIVGVVASSRYPSLRAELRPTMYRPMRVAERRNRDIHFVVRTGLGSDQLAGAVSMAASRANPDVPVTAYTTQSALIDRLLRTERLLSIASRAFGGIALVLAAVGLSGLLVYAVTRRTNEIGIRMAMGAAPGEVARMVMRDSFRLVGVGVALGLPGAAVVAQILKASLVGVEVTDPFTAAMALGALVTVAVLAAWLPARRAAAVEPTVALRDE